MKPQADCIVCERDKCCNALLHDMLNAEISLAYCIDQLDRGFYKQGLVERLKDQLKRLSKALKQCEQNNDKD